MAPRPPGASTKRARRRSPKRSSPTASKTPSSGSRRRSSSRRSSAPRSSRPTVRSPRSPTRSTPTTTTTCSTRSPSRPPPPRRRRCPSPTRPSATTASTRSSRGCCSRCAGTPDEPQQFAARVRSRSSPRSARCRSRSSAAASSTRACASTVVAPPTSGRSRPRSTSCRPAHGTGLFQRGETQVLSVLTLGMPRMEQFIGLDELRGTKKRYIHHYNFPPYSTGETGRVGSPKRREIGHGALAERALVPVVPSMEEWPYVAAHRLRRAQLERLHLDGVGVRLHALDARRRRAAQGVGRRHRHGPRLRRGQVHDPHRHPRHRGRVRRHGLQGRRHRATSSPRCSSTRRSTVSRPTCCARRCCRPATPA